MTWLAGGTVKLVGAASVAALLSLGAVGVFAQSTPSESATSVAAKASPADKAAHRAIAKATFESEAAALGMTPDALKAELKKGTKVSDLAKAKNWDKAAFTTKLLDQLTPRLKTLVGAGTIKQAQADKAVDRIKKGYIPFWDGKHHRPKK
jgi:membrane-bound lytic murein transglycosylase B